MTIKLLYPIITTGLLILWFVYPSIVRFFKKIKRKKLGMSPGDILGGAIEGLAEIAVSFFIIILYLISWIIWFIIF